MRRTRPLLAITLLLLTGALEGCSSAGSTTTIVVTSEPATTAVSDGTSVDPTTDPTHVPVVAPEDIEGPLTMTPTGIGPFRLGDRADDAIASMTGIFGKPTEDTGWDEAQSPCEGVGLRNRYVTWGRVSMTFAEGPTLLVDEKVEHLISYLVFDDPDQITPAERFVFDDGQPALGRSANEMTSWNPDVKFQDSEIEGPVWVLDDGDNSMSGTFAPPDNGVGASRTRSVRAGLICVD